MSRERTGKKHDFINKKQVLISLKSIADKQKKRRKKEERKKRYRYTHRARG